MKYETILKSFRMLNSRDVEGRMEMGKLVSTAINDLNVPRAQVAADTGFSPYILGVYAATTAFWGDDRVEGGAWHMYRSAAHIASAFPKIKVKQRILKNGWTELAKIADEVEPADTTVDVPTIETAKWELRQTAKTLDRLLQDNVSLTDAEFSVMGKQLEHIIDVAVKLGIVEFAVAA